MTGVWAACLLLAGALAIVWPERPAGWRRLLSRPGAIGRTAWGVPRPWPALVAAVRRQPRPLVLTSIAGAAAVGLLAGGPVAGVMAAVYAALAGRALLRRLARRQAAAARAAALDGLVALAADLRAGLPPVAARQLGPGPADRLARLTAAVWRLAERTGAPAADLVERIETDARAADRSAAAAAAQAAGAQATALLLAGLPVAGVALGVAIGADPVRVLLHTPLGAACALAAVLLQCCGLLWADRLAAGVRR